jgi:hypothetical protein
MERNEQEYRRANPDAPPELSRFAFLIGAWRGHAKLEREDGSWQDLEVRWEGRPILDGYAIADEYRMTTPEGELLVLGLNVRAYDPKARAWSMKWLDALGGKWVDLGPEELGGVTADEQSISYLVREPVAGHALTRATYTHISASHFTWRGERSSDGTAWEEFLVIELDRDVS